MKLVEISAPHFDLAMTLASGQVFHWEKFDNGFLGTIGDVPIYLQQCGDVLKVRAGARQLDCLKQSSPIEAGGRTGMLAKTVAHYFALDHPLAEICASFPTDATMSMARNFCRGLRIIRQPKWECLATFIASTRKKVAHIRQISLALRNRFGDPHKINPPKDGFAAANKHVIYAFPPPQRLAQSSEQKLQECALGYRAKSLLATARLVSSGETNLEAWSTLSNVDLRARLCQLPGVGAKVANCVMLFAYERLRSFPIDVWIERVLRQHYFPRRRKMTTQWLRQFSETYFGEHGGYAQQYLFHHARMNRGQEDPPSSGSCQTTARQANRSKSMSKKRNRTAAQVVSACQVG